MRTLSFDSTSHGAARAAATCLLLPALIATAPSAAAEEPAGPPAEQLVVVGERIYPVVDSVTPATTDGVDTAELLKRLPGADLNANGALTGIAQYRGLYGDRVAVDIDGLATLTGGPNSMDAPLSYASPLLLEHLRLERGIASVSSAVESIGGHVSARHDRGRHGDDSTLGLTGKAQARYASNGGMGTTAVRLVGANDTHKVALLGERDRADDLDWPGGKLTPSRLERDRYDLSYGLRHDDTELLAHAGRLATRDTGTAALPMDIRSIETDTYGLRLETPVAGSALEVALGYSDVDHVMDNFGLRTPPPTPAGLRSTHAVADGLQWRLGSRTPLDNAEWRFGIDGESATHTATITNPSVAPFRIDNFNAAERNVAGVYAQWNRAHEQLDFEAGVRVNRVATDSGPVSASIPPMTPTMQAMATNTARLADAFNASDLDRTHTNVDAVIKIGRIFGDMRNVHIELGRKTRAPSYQELYLWLPLQSTGGLADGRSYIGNPALDSEVSREINVGANWNWGSAWVAPQVFRKDISGYIQGIPSTNAVANMLAVMMTGLPALEFANTDAEIVGMDLGWGYYLSDSLVLDGTLTYARGRRTDVADNLYRLAPLNGRIRLTYEADRWLASVETLAYAAQEEVAAFNDERRTSGYGIVNASMRRELGPRLALSASIANLLDKRYQDHLAGVNRVADVDVPLGERLFGAGRSLHLGVDVSW